MKKKNKRLYPQEHGKRSEVVLALEQFMHFLNQLESEHCEKISPNMFVHSKKHIKDLFRTNNLEKQSSPYSMYDNTKKYNNLIAHSESLLKIDLSDFKIKRTSASARLEKSKFAFEKSSAPDLTEMKKLLKMA